ncbi:Transcription factor-like protein DPB, partial [Linum perenne]
FSPSASNPPLLYPLSLQISSPQTDHNPLQSIQNPSVPSNSGLYRFWGFHYYCSWKKTTTMATGTTSASGGGQSVSTSGSVGSPSSQAIAVTTPASDSTQLRLNHLDIHADDAATTQDAAADKKKKRGQRAVGADKSGRGLRQFSMKVCEKVESKGTTTYNEVADELVAEFADPSSNLAGPDQPQFDEKNIRRRVYDALNVLMALDIISKDKKEIHWKGLPRTNLSDIDEIKAERLSARNRIEKKAHYLQELEDQTRPHATVEVEISEDMQLVHFDFNSTPFELHDDNYVLKAMKLLQIPDNNGQATNMVVEGSSIHQQLLPPASPPIPGIIKARVKHEH